MLIGSIWYPNMSKRNGEDMDDETQPTKRHNGAIFADSSTSSSQRLNSPQAGSSLPGGNGSSVVATIIRNPRITKIQQTFSKKWQFYTGGFKFELMKNSQMMSSPENRIARLLGPDNKSLVTSIACLTPDCLALFMTPVEYANLPRWSYATVARIKITPLGYRLPFATNEATSGYANSQTIVQIASGIGLNTQMPCMEGAYIITESDPTDVASVSTSYNYSDYVATLYGNTDATGISGASGACLGLPVPWNNYTIIPHLDEGSVSRNNNLPMLTNFLNIQNINDCKGTPIINYSYSTKNGLLKWDPMAFQRKVLARGDPTYWHAVDNGFNSSIAIRNSDYGAVTASPQGKQEFELIEEPLKDLLAPSYDMRLEKSHWMVRNDGQNLTADRPPLLHFGVLPLQSNPALAPTPKWSSVAAIWEVECELDVTMNNDFINAGNYFLNNASFDPIRKAVYNFQWQTKSPTLYVANKFPIRFQDTPM